MQGGGSGKRFCSYNVATDANNNVDFWYYSDLPGDPYNLDGTSYGLMNWTGGNSGRAMMSSSSQENSLDVKALTVMTEKDNDEDKLFVPSDSEISKWTFHWVANDEYYMTTTVDGSTYYLQMDSSGLRLVESVDDASQIKVVPGSGNKAGQICLKSGSTTLTYSGNAENGFTVNGSAGSEWLYLVHDAEVTEDYYMTYSAQKVSISNVPNGERVIVYTRVWNEDDKRYEFYAVNSDGSLVRVYESGDSIQWNGAQLNTLLWDFTEYYWEDTQEPNYYYELYNEYSEKFIAPQQTNGQILSDDPIGINLNGRRNKRYYSSILAWDDDHYSYTGLKVENGQIVSCPKSEAMDFYFAAMEDIPTDDTLNTVPTVDNVQYGITMRMINFDSNKDQNLLLSGSENGGDTMLGTSQKCVKGLLSTNLDENGYPTAVRTGDYLGTLYSGADEVNKLFIQSTYNASGYFEYDSCQNFASLNTATNEFKVYKELGTYDGGSYPTRKHGQFFPYNDIEPGVFAVINGKNLYSATAEPLPDSDPRKNEHLYLIKNVDPHFAMELSASFTQTLNGKDAWGHDIIYEFTGDDDFWLYVDGELVIDLGGTHSAIPGFVNFSTGIVTQRGANGTNYTTTLYDIFISNYIARGMTPAAAETKAQEKFKLNDEGNWVFKEYTSHTMKIFFMERGAGASNLHMRFNLASVRPGHVNLSKELAGIDSTESVMAEFPYQIYYKTSADGEEKLLTQDAGDNLNIKVFYLDTETPVTYRDSITVGGITYPSVFMLKPGETADIEIPDDAISYRIVECGINTDIYTTASVKETGCIPIHKDGYMENRYDYSIDLAETKDRPRVTYINTVDPSAVRDMTITKKLYDETGETEIPAEDDPTSFTFRLYLGTEFDENPELANMYAYYVKDPGGHYCQWDASLKSFVSTEYTVFDDIPDKESVTFHTSINGSISKIKSGYTVELHNVLADTKYRVEERRSEIPDGYSFQRYEENGLTVAAPVEKNGTPGVEGTVAFNTDPAVTVRNLKGWGLRVNKIWADEDYMSEREPTYFAVFIQRNDPHGHGDGHVELVEDSVYQLPYDSDPQTLYWYFDRLENGTAIDQYIIREVRLTGGPYEVDENGKVINVPAHSVHSIHDGGNLQLSGKQKGETEPSEFHYTVEYEEGSISAGSNVRVDTCTNNRQGILLKKTEWDETTPLAGTVFELKDENNNLVGTFTSDEEGEITTAFLRLGIDYTLTETAAPQGWHGLQEPMTITQTANHQIEVSGVDESFYEIENVQGQMTITIKNQPYTFQAVKKDAAGNTPISGVVFALHKQKTVGGSTSIDLNPMPGYEELVTDENGIIPQLDNTLPAGTYELREKSTLDGYALLESHTQFTVSPTGEITLGSHPDGVSMERTAENGTVHFELTVLNYRRKTVRFKKIDISDLDSALEGAVFDLYEVTAEGETQTRVEPPLYTGLVSGDDGFLKDSNGHKNFELPVGIYHLVETDAPEGYVLKDRVVVVTVTADDVNYDEGTSISGDGSGKSYDPQTDVYTLKISNSTGAELPMTGGSGTAVIYILGLMLIVISGTCLLQRRNN